MVRADGFGIAGVRDGLLVEGCGDGHGEPDYAAAWRIGC